MEKRKVAKEKKDREEAKKGKGKGKAKVPESAVGEGSGVNRKFRQVEVEIVRRVSDCVRMSEGVRC
jgi:flavoprotein